MQGGICSLRRVSLRYRIRVARGDGGLLGSWGVRAWYDGATREEGVGGLYSPAPRSPDEP